MGKVALKDLLEAGSHFGHQSRRWNPAMKKYIFAQRDGVHIFDLVKTKDGLEKACEYLRTVVKDGGKVLLLGTKRQAAEIVRSTAEKTGMPYVNVRWMAGLLTNWDQVGKSIRKLATLKSQREKGELKKYTKREQLLIDREISKLEKFFGGVADLNKIPDALFIVDTHREEVAVKEARRMGVTVVGMVDTNGDPSMVDYVIPVNDDAVKSIELVMGAVEDALKGGDGEIQEVESDTEASGVKGGELEEGKEVAQEEAKEKKPRAKRVKKEAKA